MKKLTDILNMEHLEEQAIGLKRKNFKPGFDRMTADAAQIWMQINGARLIRDIADKRYTPMPAIGFVTAKINGGYRKLNKLTAIDSIIQQCILSELNEQCEAFFSPSSFAYRPGRGLGPALQQYCLSCEEYGYAAKLDPEACFDHIDHEILAKAIEEHLSLESSMAYLILQYMKMPVLSENRIIHRNEGLLQGAPLSPVLCNLYFHALDTYLEERQIPFIRYADDLVLFGNTVKETEQHTSIASAFITNQLKLTLNKAKSKICASVDMKYLGHRFMRDRHGIIVLRSDDSAEGAYFDWHQQQLRSPHRRIDILSDGVLRQKDYSLFFDTAAEDSSLPLLSIDMINIYSSVIFDSGFLQKALENQIYINYFDKHGVLLGRFLPNTALKSPTVTIEQLKTYYDEKKRLYLAKQFVLASLHNTNLVIRYYQKQYPRAIYELSLAAIKETMTKIKFCTDYNQLLLYEAAARKEYYECFDHIVKSDRLIFDKRTRRPPQSEINAMLSFGNTVLYNMLAFKINKSPLDVRIGFLHATNGIRTESLNLDIAEIFKPLIVDRVIFSLCNLKVIQEKHFVREENDAIYLNEEGKQLFLQAFYSKIEEGLTIKGRFYSYEMLMDEEIRKLVRYFKGKESYKAYKQVR